MKKTHKDKTDKQLKAKVLKDFDGHKKGDVILVGERKLRDSAREVRKGYIKLDKPEKKDKPEEKEKK
jgi:hypothetical protein